MAAFSLAGMSQILILTAKHNDCVLQSGNDMLASYKMHNNGIIIKYKYLIFLHHS